MTRLFRLYGRLLALYPRDFREAFGAQMLQTLADHHADVEAAEDHVGVRFWAAVVADELRGVATQRVASLVEDRVVTISAARVGLAAACLIPLFAVFWALTVTLALALPLPSVSGPLAIVAVATIAIALPGSLALAVSWGVAGLVVDAASRRTPGNGGSP